MTFDCVLLYFVVFFHSFTFLFFAPCYKFFHISFFLFLKPLNLLISVPYTILSWINFILSLCFLCSWVKFLLRFVLLFLSKPLNLSISVQNIISSKFMYLLPNFSFSSALFHWILFLLSPTDRHAFVFAYKDDVLLLNIFLLTLTSLFELTVLKYWRKYKFIYSSVYVTMSPSMLLKSFEHFRHYLLVSLFNE